MTDMELSTAVATFRRFEGWVTVAVDPHPEADGGMVLTLRTPGRAGRRYITLTACDGAVAVSEVLSGSRILRQVETRRQDASTDRLIADIKAMQQ